MFIDKVTKIKMPEISQEDYEKCNSIQTYNSYEINQISKVFGQGDGPMSILWTKKVERLCYFF